MSLHTQSRRLVPVALAAALVAGAATAVLASGAGPAPELITLRDAPEKLLTIRGTDEPDELRISGAGAASVTISANHSITNQRTDCMVTGPATTTAYCGSTIMKTIDAGLVEGGDELRVADDFEPNGVTVIGRGGTGADALHGSKGADGLAGGAGNDRLRGKRGKDDLDGGPDKDNCKGGPGRDRIRNCE